MEKHPPQQYRPWVIAHRGARQEAPENTRSSFEQALHYPVDGIEFDVQMSADGVPVVCHDPTLYRINGQRRRISSCRYDELAALDWGGWFDPRFAGEPLPTLEQTLETLLPHTRLLVEIKADTLERCNGRAYELARVVAALLAQRVNAPYKERIHVLSFDPEVLRIVHRQTPGYPCVLNLTEKHVDLLLSAPPNVVPPLWAVDVSIAGLSPAVVQWVRRRRMRLFTYTCNTPRQVAKALGFKVDGIVSDRPGWLTDFFR
jgi:glycerophosphoryl diester phosphodiesterase